MKERQLHGHWWDLLGGSFEFIFQLRDADFCICYWLTWLGSCFSFQRTMESSFVPTWGVCLCRSPWCGGVFYGRDIRVSPPTGPHLCAVSFGSCCLACLTRWFTNDLPWNFIFFAPVWVRSLSLSLSLYCSAFRQLWEQVLRTWTILPICRVQKRTATVLKCQISMLVLIIVRICLVSLVLRQCSKSLPLPELSNCFFGKTQHLTNTSLPFIELFHLQISP